MIGFYLRTSLPTDENRNSIENQRRLLLDYVTNNNLNPDEDIILEYIDDGVSGASGDRPAFKKLLEDCKRGKIHLLLAKDLSRLGRDYIEIMDYIERTFPLLGVRIILVVNSFDSSKTVDGTMDIVTSVTNVANTYYLMDLSRKAKSAKRARWKKGILTTTVTPIGYICDNTAEGWKVDPDGKEIVRKIFDMAIQGMRAAKIARKLNKDGVMTPYRYLKSIDRHSGRTVTPDELLVWESSTVASILKNEEYTGVLIQGKTAGIAPGKKKTRRTSPEEQFRHEGHHEAIVSKEEFEKVRALIAQRGTGVKASTEPTVSTEPKTTKYKNKEPGWMLAGLVRCGTCGRTLGMITRKTAVCHRNGCGCRVDIDIVLDEVRAAVEMKRAECRKKLEEISADSTEPTYPTELQERKEPTDLKSDEICYKELQEMMIECYEEYVQGRYSAEDFRRDRKTIEKEMEKLKERIRRGKMVKIGKDDRAADLRDFLQLTEGVFGREMALAVIDKVVAGEKTDVMFKRV